MGASRAAEAAGKDLEHAVRAYEAALAEHAPGRHARPDDDDHLQRLRMQVIRMAEALPSACWPRPVCVHCRGHREVDTVRTSQEHDAAAPETIKQRRLCPVCWGTGMTPTRQAAS